MKKIYVFLFLSLLIGGHISAQKNPKIDKQTYFASQEGAIEAKKAFSKAESYYKKGAGTYDEALKYYMQLYAYNPKSHALNYKIGICYLYTANKKAALDYLLLSSPEIASDYFLALGRAYQYNFMFDEAKDAYGKYLSGLYRWQQFDAKKYVAQLTAECDVSKKIMEDSLPAYIVNLGPVINSYYDEYNAMLPKGDTSIYFTSKRPEKEPRKRVSRFKFNERILATNNCIDVPSQYAVPLNKLDFTDNTGVVGFNNAERKIYFYNGSLHNGRLYSASYEKGRWKKIQPLKGKINHIAYKETSLSIASDGTAYFVTDRRGGLGGKDIWVSKQSANGKFAKPYNIGDVINTPFDEEGVYVTEDGTALYFSSKGHPGMGGYDVYKSEKGVDGLWSKPVNMGHPINSPADELFYRPTEDSLVALYATIRPDSYGGLDIYKIQIDPSIPFKLIGAVNDVEDGSIIQASLSIYDKETEKLIKTAEVDSLAGIYMIDFEDVGEYTIQVDYEGYKSLTNSVTLPETKYATVVQDFQLEKLRHPFTLIGRVTDVDKGSPLQATLLFKQAATDTVIGRAVSNGETGKYSITFDDKYDMVMDVEALDYFSINEAINTTNEENSVISKNIELKRSKVEYTLTGRIAQEGELSPVKAAISFYLPSEEEPFAIIVSDSSDGKYTAVLEEQGPFMMEVEANGYFFLNEIYQFPEGQTFTAKNFDLKKMETGVKIVVKNILFNTGKSTLKTESYAELDKLANLLDKNPSIKIEVSGHTDNVGSASVNKKISKTRALTVKNYLVSRGILSDRILYEGYGFDQPIAPNDTPENRAKNRRVEVKILD